MAGRPPILFPADAGTPSIDRHSGRWCAQNVAKWPREGATGGARPGKHNGRSAPGRRAGKLPPAPVKCRWTIGRRRGRMGTQNSKRQAVAGSPAPWRTCQNTDMECDRGMRSPTGPQREYGRPHDRSRTWQDDRPKSQCSSCSL